MESSWCRTFSLALFGARLFGHGRAIEAFLACVALSYGTSLMVDSRAKWDSQATRDLMWWGWNIYVIWVPLLMKGILTGYGVLANINDWAFSRSCRIVGAMLGTVIWVWFVVKFYLVGATFTLGFWFSCWAYIFSIRIMVMAAANLPTPGTPGAK